MIYFYRTIKTRTKEKKKMDEKILTLTTELQQAEEEKLAIENFYKGNIDDLTNQIQELQMKREQIRANLEEETEDVRDRIEWIKSMIVARMRELDVKKIENDEIKLTTKHHNFDKMSEFKIVNQKEVKSNYDMIATFKEECPDLITTVETIDLRRLKTAVKEGQLILSDGKLITQNGEVLPVELEKNCEEFEVKVSYK